MNSSEAAIRQIIESRANAVRKGNVEAMSADVADDVIIFDVVVPLRRLGKAASRARAADWVASYEGAIGWESRDVEVFADGDVAFSHSLSHVTGKQKTGAEVDMWFRTTLGLQPTKGTSQEHVFHQDGTRRSGRRLVPKARVRPANRCPDPIGAI